ncbi:MAG: hypothetical protein HYY03_05885 [Chloroflexi bacterium]|nr:hypothetical protein [Chloroflexota bacterium]
MPGRRLSSLALPSAALLTLIVATACEDGASEPTATEDVGVTSSCRATSGFATTGDNAYFPLQAGETRRYEGTEDDEEVVLVITTLGDTETVAGVETRVVEESESKDGEVVEVSRNFFAAASDGSVCYFGEDVDIYEGGEIVSHEGAWRAGQAGAVQGIIMPGQPAAGQSYDQERAAGVAQDHAEVLSTSGSLTVLAGAFSDVLKTRETTPLEPGVEEFKWYASGVGLIRDGVLELVQEP